MVKAEGRAQVSAKYETLQKIKHFIMAASGLQQVNIRKCGCRETMVQIKKNYPVLCRSLNFKRIMMRCH